MENADRDNSKINNNNISEINNNNISEINNNNISDLNITGLVMDSDKLCKNTTRLETLRLTKKKNSCDDLSSLNTNSKPTKKKTFKKFNLVPTNTNFNNKKSDDCEGIPKEPLIAPKNNMETPQNKKCNTPKFRQHPDLLAENSGVAPNQSPVDFAQFQTIGLKLQNQDSSNNVLVSSERYNCDKSQYDLAKKATSSHLTNLTRNDSEFSQFINLKDRPELSKNKTKMSQYKPQNIKTKDQQLELSNLESGYHDKEIIEEKEKILEVNTPGVLNHSDNVTGLTHDTNIKWEDILEDEILKFHNSVDKCSRESSNMLQFAYDIMNSSKINQKWFNNRMSVTTNFKTSCFSNYEMQHYEETIDKLKDKYYLKLAIVSALDTKNVFFYFIKIIFHFERLFDDEAKKLEDNSAHILIYKLNFIIYLYFKTREDINLNYRSGFQKGNKIELIWKKSRKLSNHILLTPEY